MLFRLFAFFFHKVAPEKSSIKKLYMSFWEEPTLLSFTVDIFFDRGRTEDEKKPQARELEV
jgi:hypothetical protein